jgi:hypothetical protein
MTELTQRREYFIEFLTNIFNKIDYSVIEEIYLENNISDYDIFVNCCKRNREEDEFIIQKLIYHNLLKETPDNSFLLYYPLIFNTSFPHTLIHPLCSAIENIFLSYEDNKTKNIPIIKKINRIEEHIGYISLTLKTLKDTSQVKKRIISTYLRILKCKTECVDEVLLIINMLSSIVN